MRNVSYIIAEHGRLIWPSLSLGHNARYCPSLIHSQSDVCDVLFLQPRAFYRCFFNLYVLLPISLSLFLSFTLNLSFSLSSIPHLGYLVSQVELVSIKDPTVFRNKARHKRTI